MTRYLAEPWLKDLTAFQRRSVDHVFRQFYEAGASRFLVADETGLGKTRVAQGVIARAIEHLQDAPNIDRIDVVYVCANSDLARQNIRRLNVTGQGEIPFSSRLTLLGEHSRRLNKSRGTGAVNLVSFTPGTSFEMGHSLGQARERAMIAIALMQLYDLNGWEQKATKRMLQGGVATPANFQRQIDWLRGDLGSDGIDPAIVDEYRKLLNSGGESSLGFRYLAFLEALGRRHSIPRELHDEGLDVVRALRATLAAASVHTLEPDLVILDEFQRFRHLLSEDTAAGELAHHLFQYDAAKVLLLSATPYKPFTLGGDEEEDHARDLFRTLEFLARGRSDVRVDEIRSGLRGYRESLVDGTADESIPRALREQLLKVMSRAERPALPGGSMTAEHVVPADEVRAADLADYAIMHRVASAVKQPRDHGLVTTEYWKSAPYFLNFADGYQLGKRLRDSSLTLDLREALRLSPHLSGATLQRFDVVEPGNARMRVLTRDTVDQGWWQLLWMPPSLTYIEAQGPYAEDFARNMTKRLVFSSWTATPSSVASLLSYEAERRAVAGSEHYTAYTPEARAKIARRLQYTANADGKPKQMAAFLLHWPLLGLARELDPLKWIAVRGGVPLSPHVALDLAREVVQARLAMPTGHEDLVSTSDHDGAWRAAFSWADSWPAADDRQCAQAISGNRSEGDDDPPTEEPGDIPNGLLHHVRSARSARDDRSSAQGDDVDLLAEVGLYSPANISLRALNRLVGDGAVVTEWGLFEAAAVLANGLRSLFNRPDAIQLIEQLGGPPGMPYWHKVLRYIAMGNLEAVLDEYLHQLFADHTSGPATDKLLAELAREVSEAVSLRSPTLRALDPSDLSNNLAFAARFALRYGGRQQETEDARQPEVRRAFNSPFWPFVLASTSVGQEGIDFHWWCHAVFHWNTPSNPVDFEQREGRVDRYRGHAVRKNVAAKHGNTALTHGRGNPWGRLYALATDHQDELGDFSPGWVYPGPNQIERHVAPFAFSTDLDRYDRMKRDVALYRLTFGQPRQEDMLEVLRRRGVDADPESMKAFRIDLAP